MRKCTLGLLASLSFLVPITAWSAGTLNLSYDSVYNGSVWITNPASGTGITNAPTVPSSLNYGNSFFSATTQDPTYGYGFYDDFVFTITGANANSVTTTIDLGSTLQISNLQERLYSYDTNPTTPILGVPVGGAIDAWTSPIGTVGTVAVLPTTILAPGTYVLQIRGNVTGTSGGSYAGTLNLAEVPLPEPWAMMLSGLGLLGLSQRRRLKDSH